MPPDIKNLIKKREKIKRRKSKTNENKIEFSLICKLINKSLREYNHDKKSAMIQQILDSTRSTKSIKKNLMLGKNWTT